MTMRCKNQFGEIAYYIKPNRWQSESQNKLLAVFFETLKKAVTLEKYKCVKLKNMNKIWTNSITIDKLFKTNSNKLSVDEIKTVIKFLDISFEESTKLDQIPIDDIVDFLFKVAQRYTENNSIEEIQKINALEQDNIENNLKTDIPIAKPEARIENGRKSYIRNVEMKKKALEKAQFYCEYDKTHKYFISLNTNQNYVEGHHLIPMEFQDEFDFSLDVEANMVSLCVVCHKKIHHGINSDKKIIIETLYEQRKERLASCNILTTYEKLYDYYNKEF